MTILDKLLDLAAQHFDFPREKLHPNDDFFEVLGIHSLDAMELLTEVEDAFDVEIPDYELQGVNTFKNLAEIIESRL